MAKATNAGPFPPLTWDGWDWRGTFSLPWFPSAKSVDLTVCVQPLKARSELAMKAAPNPGEPQAAALRDLLEPSTKTAVALLTALHENVPELQGAGWNALGEAIELTNVSIFTTAADGVSYVAFIFGCLQWEWGYEHGFGIVAHRGRVASFGFAEAADESEALKDARRQAKRERM